MNEQPIAARPGDVPPSPNRLDTAVLLGLEAHGLESRIDAFTVVGGLPLLVRAILTLQRAGLRRVIIPVGEDDRRYHRTIQQYPQIAVSLQWMPSTKLPSDLSGWEALAAEAGGFLLFDPCTVCSPELIANVCQTAHGGQLLAVVGQPFEPARSAESLSASEGNASTLCMVVVPASSAVETSRTRENIMQQTPAGRLGPGAFAPLLGNNAAAEVEFLPATPLPCWAIRKPADVSLAEQALLRSLKADFEGIVDTYLNRPVSCRLSRIFLRIGFSPNAITVLSVLIGLIGAVTIALGSYSSAVIGTLLFQLSAIVDCCDGEVARVTFAESRVGALLDLLGDNLAHLAVFAGVAWSVYVQGSVLTWMPAGLPLVLGAAAMLANVLSLWLVLRAKRLRDREQLGSAERTGRVDLILRKVASRDFSVVLLAFALFNWLELFLWAAAIGSNVFWMILGWITRPSIVSALPAHRPLPGPRPVREPRA